MLYSSATNNTPSLVSFTRHLIGDPSDGVGRTLFTPNEVRHAINLAYDALRDKMRRQEVGWTNKVTYLSPVAGEIHIDLPDDFVRVERLDLDVEGRDLSQTPLEDATLSKYTYSTEDQAMDAFHAEGVETTPVYFLSDQQVGLVPPANEESAGTNTLRLTYQASTPHLTNPTDEPAIPRPHHELICYRAAISLGEGRGLSEQVFDLRNGEIRRESDFLRATRNCVP